MSEHDWQTHAKLAAVAIRGTIPREAVNRLATYP